MYMYVCVSVCVCLTVMSASQSSRLLTLYWHVPLHPSLVTPATPPLPSSLPKSSPKHPPAFSIICLDLSIPTFFFLFLF